MGGGGRGGERRERRLLVIFRHVQEVPELENTQRDREREIDRERKRGRERASERERERESERLAHCSSARTKVTRTEENAPYRVTSLIWVSAMVGVPHRPLLPSCM